MTPRERSRCPLAHIALGYYQPGRIFRECLIPRIIAAIHHETSGGLNHMIQRVRTRQQVPLDIQDHRVPEYHVLIDSFGKIARRGTAMTWKLCCFGYSHRIHRGTLDAK